METARADPRARRRRRASSPRAPGSAPARSAARSAASAGSRSRPAPPVLPVAVHGTEHVRRGWRIRPRKVKLRAGKPMTFPRTEQPLAGARRDGHRPDLAQHRAAVGVARRPAAAAQGGGDRRRQLGHRGRRAARPRRARGPARHPHRRAGRARSLASARTSEYLPGVQLPDGLDGQARRRDRARRAATWSASPSPRRRCPHAVGALADRIGSRAVGAAALQGPRRSRWARCRPSTSPSASAPARSPASAARPTRGRRPPAWPRSCSAAPTPTCARSSARSSTAPAWSASAPTTSPASRWPAPPRTPPRSPPPPPSRTASTPPGSPPPRSGASASSTRSPRGGRLETFTGLAGVGDLTATVLAPEQPQPARRRAARRRASRPSRSRAGSARPRRASTRCR